MEMSNPKRLLSRRLRRFFTSITVKRGEEYFYGHLIEDFNFHEEGASALVHGSEIYSIIFDWSRGYSGKLKAACTCVHFSDGNFCKHIWAVALKIDSMGGVPIDTLRGTIMLQFGEPKTIGRGDIARSDRAHSLASPPTKSLWRNSFISTSNAKTLSFPKTYRQDGFVVLSESHKEGAVRFKFFISDLDANGNPLLARPFRVPQLGDIPFGTEQFKSSVKAIVKLARGEMVGSQYSYYQYSQDLTVRELGLDSLRFLLPHLFDTQRVFAHKDHFFRFKKSNEPLAFQAIEFGGLHLQVSVADGGYLLSAFVEVASPIAGSGSLTLTPVEKIKLLVSPNFYQLGNSVGFVDLNPAEQAWFDELKEGPLQIPREDEEAFLEAVLSQGLKFGLPEELNWPHTNSTPTSKVELKLDRESGFQRYIVDLKFGYSSRQISFWSQLVALPAVEDRQIHLRNKEYESEILSKLDFKLCSQRREEDRPTLHAQHLIEFVKGALANAIPVEVENKKVEEAKDFKISVSSGVDWFDVDGEADFSGRWVKYPAILEAISRGEKFVPLADGALGLVSEHMAKRLEKLAAFAEKTKDGLRFSSAQGLILNSLLEDEPNVNLDQKFKALREKIKCFSGIKLADPAKSFSGRLRKYQREGLGWLKFLENFGFGGILADDMGLGKTIQCLAFLDGRRSSRRRPSLLVAPKSLLDNWKREAKKFTPELRVLIHAGLERNDIKAQFKDYDLVVTTYQTMLRDIAILKDIDWDAVIADEAQAIKNPEALISKALKILNSKFRLAMTGTPIENSIQDLFSISDFVNPGFLNGSRRSSGLKVGDEAREALSRAFKPVVLRRTKDQVLKDLPEKTEQLISVDLDSKQLKVYNELKRFYQSQLLKDVREKGVKKSQIQILAALTRLRQAALHPGLIDINLKKAKSSKFEVVLEMLEEVIAENHRVLIFSQFTSLLQLFKAELKVRKIKFSYLDGQTARRQQVVDEFKTSDHPVFLISLKAGGVGLNLVEADYVFLLDPWWNPAVEAQAIDRVHRIGQKRAVNAYRFIAKNTVEEKILDLQNTKRDLANDIIDKKSSPLRSLTAQDIESLFS